MLIDTHCHLDFPQFDKDRDEVIKRAQDNKVDYLINVGSSLESSFKSKELTERFVNIFFSIGFHPHYADKFNKDALAKLESLSTNKKLVAVGEIGLDYYKSLSAKEKQKQAFLEFINFAKKLNLPLILHSRESHLDMLEILKAERVDFSKVVFHCFSGDQDFLNRCLDLGVMFSFTGNITYPKATRLRELISRIPLDKIMLETDSPYLAPQKFRGQRNEPAYVHFVAQELAIIKKKNIQEIADITTQNAKRFFKLEP